MGGGKVFRELCKWDDNIKMALQKVG